MFATDHLVLPVAKDLVTSGKDKSMFANERLFVYMCIQHSEILEDVKLAEELMKGLAEENVVEHGRLYDGILKSARGHVEMVESASRFSFTLHITHTEPHL